MPVKRDETGRRSVQAEVEVPGTPEEVWRAIATGEGISAWFVPTEVRDDGTVVANFGPGMESISRVTAWEPPRRFMAESADLGQNAPVVATEWIVEARSGGTCIVRVVHSLFADGDDWDGQLEGWEGGWPAFFRILRLYVAHFRGQPSAAFQTMAVAPEPVADAWDRLSGALGLAGAAQGDDVRSSEGAPRLAGRVEHAGPPTDPELLLRTGEPAPGLAHLFAMPMGGQVYLSVRLYLYGENLSDAAERERSVWQRWLNDLFGPAGPADVSGGGA